MRKAKTTIEFTTRQEEAPPDSLPAEPAALDSIKNRLVAAIDKLPYASKAEDWCGWTEFKTPAEAIDFVTQGKGTVIFIHEELAPRMSTSWLELGKEIDRWRLKEQVKSDFKKDDTEGGEESSVYELESTHAGKEEKVMILRRNGDLYASRMRGGKLAN